MLFFASPIKHFFTFAMKMLGPVPSRSGPRLHSLQQELANITINPRRVGGMNFPSSAGGGGRFTPLRLTRLLGHVATRGKRQSKERQK